MSHWKEWYPYLPLPPFPAIFGLDAAGEVTEVGARVRDIVVGDRVYVNPGIGCGACSACKMCIRDRPYVVRRADTLSSISGYWLLLAAHNPSF